jgi:hypothetical protein
MLFFKTQERFWPELKTFLVFLNYMPDTVVVGNRTYKGSDIVLDEHIAGILRNI